MVALGIPSVTTGTVENSFRLYYSGVSVYI